MFETLTIIGLAIPFTIGCVMIGIWTGQFLAGLCEALKSPDVTDLEDFAADLPSCPARDAWLKANDEASAAFEYWVKLSKRSDEAFDRYIPPVPPMPEATPTATETTV